MARIRVERLWRNETRGMRWYEGSWLEAEVSLEIC